MEKQYLYISQPDLDEFAPASIKRNVGQYDDFGIPLAFADKFWGKDSAQAEMARVKKGFNTGGLGTIDSEKELAIFRAIMEQNKKGIGFFSLEKAINVMSGEGNYFICSSFRMEMNRRYSTQNFIQLNGSSECIYENDIEFIKIVMGMSVSKTILPYDELNYQIRQASQFDIWGRLYKFDHEDSLPSFQFKPFVVGFNWISSISDRIKDLRVM